MDVSVCFSLTVQYILTLDLLKPGVKRFDAILGAMSVLVSETVNHKIILIWYEPILEDRVCVRVEDICQAILDDLNVKIIFPREHVSSFPCMLIPQCSGPDSSWESDYRLTPGVNLILEVALFVVLTGSRSFALTCRQKNFLEIWLNPGF